MSVKSKTCHLLDQITKKDNEIVDMNKNMELVQRSNESIVDRQNWTTERLNEKLKVVKKSNINAKRQYENVVSVQEKKSQK